MASTCEIELLKHATHVTAAQLAAGEHCRTCIHHCRMTRLSFNISCDYRSSSDT